MFPVKEITLGGRNEELSKFVREIRIYEGFGELLGIHWYWVRNWPTMG